MHEILLQVSKETVGGEENFIRINEGQLLKVKCLACLPSVVKKLGINNEEEKKQQSFQREKSAVK